MRKEYKVKAFGSNIGKDRSKVVEIVHIKAPTMLLESNGDITPEGAPMRDERTVFIGSLVDCEAYIRLAETGKILEK